jgi:Thiamine pyrophosphate-requiring enzymes [acetolactate synthase, pyruvate dehydrogenase (cytochrome), glyoxylate carboligase, phosphonopyruvate decarboxylase]
VIVFGDDVWRAGAQAEAVKLAELLEAPVFASRQIFVNFPSRHPLYCGAYPIAKDFEKISGLKPDLLFLVGCQGVHGAVTEPSVMQIGPNPLLMGRHYPLDLAAQCELRETLGALTEAVKRVHPSDKVTGWARQRAKVRAYAKMLIEREENLVREHEHDPVVHPAVLEAHLAEILPRETAMVQEARRRAPRFCPSDTRAWRGRGAAAARWASEWERPWAPRSRWAGNGRWCCIWATAP